MRRLQIHTLFLTLTVMLLAVVQAQSLHPLRWSDSPEVARAAIEAGADLEERDEAGRTPLMRAVQLGLTETIEVLISAGAEVDARDKSDRTPLMLAVRESHDALSVVEILIEAGADLEARDVDGWTALTLASGVADPEVMLTLIRAGVDVNARTIVGRTALHNVNIGNWSDEELVLVTRALIEVGAVVDARTDDGTTPLMEAASRGSSGVIGVLLAAGANIEAKDDNGWTPLMRACRSGLGINGVQTLISAGADIAARDQDGWTALMHASRFLQRWSLEGDDVQAVVARYSLSKALSDMTALLEAGANLEARSASGATALMLASGFGYPAQVKLLLDAGANIAAEDVDGWTPVI